MATKPLTSEAIALAEKKMDMTLDDIIKLSKTNSAKPRKQRASNKSRRFSNATQDKALKMRQYMDSRSTLRQGVLAQRRSSFQGKSFPLATEAARKAAIVPFHSRLVNRNRPANWNKPRPAGPTRQQGNPSNGVNAPKKQHQTYQTGDSMLKQKPKTLDSLFANMKEQRMRTYTHKSSDGVVGRRRGEPRQPWLRGRFGKY